MTYSPSHSFIYTNRNKSQFETDFAPSLIMQSDPIEVDKLAAQ